MDVANLNLLPAPGFVFDYEATIVVDTDGSTQQRSTVRNDLYFPAECRGQLASLSGDEVFAATGSTYVILFQFRQYPFQEGCAVERSSGMFGQTGGFVSEFFGEIGPVDVDPEARDKGRSRCDTVALTQNSAGLTLSDHDVVGPLESYVQAAVQADGAGYGDSEKKGQEPHRSRRFGEDYQGTPQAHAGRRMP